MMPTSKNYCQENASSTEKDQKKMFNNIIFSRWLSVIGQQLNLAMLCTVK